MNCKKLFAICCMLMLFSPFLHAQDLSLRGEILDDEGFPLPGVTIVLKDNLSYGTVSNSDGKFELKVETLPVTLKISCIGFGEKEILVRKAEVGRILLEESFREIDEVLLLDMVHKRRVILLDLLPPLVQKK